jgi:hypothetical protein
MAQTVALYRGEITVASGTIATIFTNTSSGTATRLRVGWLSWICDVSTTSTRFALYVAPAGLTYSTVIGTIVPGASGIRFQSALPLQGDPSIEFVITSNQITGGNPTLITGAPATGNNRLFYIQDTMIGPGDVIKVGWQEGASTAAIVSYCFTTITES